MAEVQVRADEYRELAGQLKGAEKPILAAMRKEMRVAGKPAGERTLDAIAAAMPNRGGLSALVKSRGSVSVQVNRTGVRLQLANRAGLFMGQFEAGLVRHPVWGRWLRGQAPQPVPGNKGAEQFESEADGLTDAVVAAMTRAAAAHLEARGG